MQQFSSEIAKQKIRDSKAKMELELEEQRQYEEAMRQEELEEKRKAKLVTGLTPFFRSLPYFLYLIIFNPTSSS